MAPSPSVPETRLDAIYSKVRSRAAFARAPAHVRTPSHISSLLGAPVDFHVAAQINSTFSEVTYAQQLADLLTAADPDEPAPAQVRRRIPCPNAALHPIRTQHLQPHTHPTAHPPIPTRHPSPPAPAHPRSSPRPRPRPRPSLPLQLSAKSAAQRWGRLGKEVSALVARPATAGTLALAFARLKPERLSDSSIARLVQRLGLSVLDTLLVGIALATAGAEDSVAPAGARLVRDALGEAIAAIRTGAVTVDEGAAHSILAALAAPPAALGPVPADLHDALVSALRLRLPAAKVAPALLPLLHPTYRPTAAASNNSSSMEDKTSSTGGAAPSAAGSAVSLARVMHELGYACCTSVAVCSNLVNQVSAALARPIEEEDVTMVLGMMVRTQGYVVVVFSGAPLTVRCSGPNSCRPRHIAPPCRAVDDAGVPLLSEGRANAGDGKEDGLAAWNIDVFFEAVRQVVCGPQRPKVLGRAHDPPAPSFPFPARSLPS